MEFSHTSLCQKRGTNIEWNDLPHSTVGTVRKNSPSPQEATSNQLNNLSEKVFKGEMLRMSNESKETMKWTSGKHKRI